jgi:hypothetical protein
VRSAECGVRSAECGVGSGEWGAKRPVALFARRRLRRRRGRSGGQALYARKSYRGTGFLRTSMPKACQRVAGASGPSPTSGKSGTRIPTPAGSQKGGTQKTCPAVCFAPPPNSLSPLNLCPPPALGQRQRRCGPLPRVGRPDGRPTLGVGPISIISTSNEVVASRRGSRRGRGRTKPLQGLGRMGDGFPGLARADAVNPGLADGIPSGFPGRERAKRPVPVLRPRRHPLNVDRAAKWGVGCQKPVPLFQPGAKNQEPVPL